MLRPRRFGDINSGIGSTRFKTVKGWGIGSTRFIVGHRFDTVYCVASVRHGLLCGIGSTRFIVWHRFDTVYLCGIGSTRFKTVKGWGTGIFRGDRAIPIRK